MLMFEIGQIFFKNAIFQNAVVNLTCIIVVSCILHCKRERERETKQLRLVTTSFKFALSRWFNVFFSFSVVFH
jgi:hypothetical protein